MSSGDGSIDNKLASVEKLREIVASHPFIAKQMDRQPEYNDDYDIPFVAGACYSLQRVYFHRLLKPKVTIGARIVDLRDFMWRHELLEAMLVMLLHYTYDAAHEFGNLAEALALRDANISYDAYNAKIDVQVKLIEKAPIVRVPHDLLLYPYRNSPTIFREIRKAQASG